MRVCVKNRVLNLLHNVSVEKFGMEQKQVVVFYLTRGAESWIAFSGEHVVSVDGYARMLLDQNEHHARVSV
jgi:hypothetical protein